MRNNGFDYILAHKTREEIEAETERQIQARINEDHQRQVDQIRKEGRPRALRKVR